MFAAKLPDAKEEFATFAEVKEVTPEARKNQLKQILFTLDLILSNPKFAKMFEPKESQEKLGMLAKKLKFKAIDEVETLKDLFFAFAEDLKIYQNPRLLDLIHFRLFKADALKGICEILNHQHIFHFSLADLKKEFMKLFNSKPPQQKRYFVSTASACPQKLTGLSEILPQLEVEDIAKLPVHYRLPAIFCILRQFEKQERVPKYNAQKEAAPLKSYDLCAIFNKLLPHLDENYKQEIEAIIKQGADQDAYVHFYAGILMKQNPTVSKARFAL